MQQSVLDRREDEIAWLGSEIARLEAEATRSVSRPVPDTAHDTRKDYDDICEEIISLKRRLKQLRQN